MAKLRKQVRRAAATADRATQSLSELRMQLMIDCSHSVVVRCPDDVVRHCLECGYDTHLAVWDELRRTGLVRSLWEAGTVRTLPWAVFYQIRHRLQSRLEIHWLMTGEQKKSKPKSQKAKGVKV